MYEIYDTSNDSLSFLIIFPKIRSVDVQTENTLSHRKKRIRQIVFHDGNLSKNIGNHAGQVLFPGGKTDLCRWRRVNFAVTISRLCNSRFMTPICATRDGTSSFRRDITQRDEEPQLSNQNGRRG